MFQTTTTGKSIDEIVMELLKFRRSVRLFDGKKIPEDQILSIIEAGVWAPTGCNNQELRFMVLQRAEELAEFLKFKRCVKGCTAVILIFCDMSLPRSQRMYVECKAERHLPWVDTGLALAHMTLYAVSKGIDSCIINLSEHHGKPMATPSRIKWRINRIKKTLNLHRFIDSNFEFFLRKHLHVPDRLKIMCGLALGYRKEFPDVNVATHGGKKIMRDDVRQYVIPTSWT